MKKLAFLGLAIAALSISAAPSLKNANKSLEARDATIIVKLKGNVDKVSHDYVIASQNALLDKISSTVTSNYKVLTRYSNVINGFVMEVPSAYVSSIRYLPGVEDVNYNNILATTSSIKDGVRYEIKTNGVNATASSKTMEKPDGTNDGSGTFIAILDEAFYINDTEYHEVFSPLDAADAVITQASLKAKIDAASGFHGKYNSKNSTYFNNKVPFYYDYAGDKQGSAVGDYVVYAEGFDHGSHVASIAAGNAPTYKGVAPKAQLALMKVFTTYMSGSSYESGAPASAILSALEDCLVLGVDSINMSLGSPLLEFDDNNVVYKAIKALRNKGAYVNVSAGNEGKGQWNNYGYQYWQADEVEGGFLGNYATSLDANAVASCQADSQFYGEALTVDGNNIQFEDQVTGYNSTSGKVTYNPERHLVDLMVGGRDEFDFVKVPGLGKPEDFNGLDVNGKIAVIDRGDITFKEKVDNSVAKGAIAVFIIDNTNATEFNFRMSFSDDNSYNPAVPVCSILNRDGHFFNESTTNKIKLIVNADLNNPSARTISDYSSDGIRADLTIKPDITTPGQNIKGAVTGATDKYESMSGTSMAAPNMTGAVALMISQKLGDNNYRESVISRLMSTAQPMRDGTPENNFTSVRRQGAGLVNLDAAINSKVYLDGVDANGNGIKKAKIELRNNPDIKAGKLNLSFLAINEGSAAVSYTAKTYVLKPQLQEFNSDNYPDWEGQKYQTLECDLVQVFTDTVNIPVGSTKITLPEHAIDADKLAAIDADFENGCYLEGFTILEANGDLKQLSIPFLGYYGDLDKVSPVVPFDFERVDDNKVYNSDFLNYFIQNNLQENNGTSYANVDYSSRIVAGYWSDTSKVSVSGALVKNTTGLTKMTDGNSNKVKSVGMNPYTGQLSKDALFVGNNGYSNTMIIQQCVNRAVYDNTLTLKNKATGEVVLTDHMFDNLSGTGKDEVTGEVTHPLYKSHFCTNFYDNGYMAHRAYSIIPLYDQNAVTKVQNNYPDGEYEMKFEYKLNAGSTYTLTYNLTIESNLPILQDIEKVSEGGKDYYRFSYNDANVCMVNINETPYEVKKVGDKMYADVPASEFAKNNTVLVNSIDTAFGQDTFVTHVDDENMVMVYNQMFISGYGFNYTVEGKGTNDQTFTFEITKNDKVVSVNGDVMYRMRVPYGLDIDSLNITSINAKGQEKKVDFVKMGDLIEFAHTAKTFHLTSNFVPGTEVVTSLTITGPSKTSYNIGDTFDPAGLVVTANYNNGTTKVLEASEYVIGDVDMSTAGEKTVTVTYNDNVVGTFTITVNDAKAAGCGGSIVACGSSMLLVVALGITFITLKKKRFSL